MNPTSKHLSWNILCVIGSSLLIADCFSAQSSDIPTKPIRVLVGMVPGGGTDITARAVAQKLGERLGQLVITDNRAGASGAIAREIVRSSAPDGHTLLLLTPSQIVNANMVQKDPVDIRDAFSHITLLVWYPYLLVSHPSAPIKSMKDLLAYAKSKPGALNYGTPGIGTTAHLGTELLNHIAKIDMVHVPYKGSGDVVRDLLGGQLMISFASAISTMPHVKSGKLRLVAVSSEKRSRYMPDAPTVAEGGVPGYDLTGWYSMATAPRTPRNIVMRLNKEISASLESPELQKNFAADAAETEPTSPEQLKEKINQELKKWGDLLAAGGIKL